MYCLDGEGGGASAYPTNYDDNQHTQNTVTGGGVSVAFATRNATGSSEDPGTFTSSTTNNAVAATVSVRQHPGLLTNTNIDTAYNVKICDDASGTNCSALESITINGPTCTPPNCTEGSGASSCDGDDSDCPGDSDAHDITCPGTDAYPETNDNYFYRFIDSNGTAAGDGECGDALNCVIDTVPADVRWSVFDEDASTPAWCVPYDADYELGDTTAPVLGTPIVSCTDGDCDITVTTTELNGTAWVLANTSATATVAQCQASSDTTPVSSSPIMISVTITTEDDYYFHACQQDVSSNDSAVTTSALTHVTPDTGSGGSSDGGCPHDTAHPSAHTSPYSSAI